MKALKKKILIADADPKFHQKLKRAADSKQYHFESVFDGSACLHTIESNPPDLLIIDLLLPHIHGIEILRKIKTDPRKEHIGVIVCSYHMMLQNYYSALLQHADYCLEKLFNLHDFFQILRRFFTGKLEPTPFKTKEYPTPSHKYCYAPKATAPLSYIKFWGTRGSNPVSGSDYVRFGGNTSCLEVRHLDDLLIFDAGTGILPLGTALSAKKPKNVHILFSHTHWDHIVGFPFFSSIYDPNCHIHIWTPIGFEKTTKEIFTEMLAYTYFPVRLDDIQAALSFHEIKEQEPFAIGEFEINTHYAFHAGPTLGFKISHKRKKIGYVTDNEFLMGYHGNPNAIKKSSPLLAPYLSQVRFFQDCDLLIHEAQYTPKEYQHKVGWGHSSIANAALLIKYAEIPEWIVTHHDPRHTDADLFKKISLHYDILADCNISCRFQMASDDLTIPL